jgi:hypothetical protein
MICVSASIAFVLTRQMMGRSHVQSAFVIGNLLTILHKIHKREPLTDEEISLAREVLADAAI